MFLLLVFLFFCFLLGVFFLMLEKGETFVDLKVVLFYVVVNT